ncbi:DUF1302 domain-containing protein [Parendozoicomonas haliclonae]|uniref:DUF1302 domain-containing protein n=1 Tax=Parendozoicomonas haliclonae TaxID=1960125 RepID=A0A1X7ARC5_9GAMM|nr:DUF1302 family protein [Parendozoicomonas haliclonae]SMA50864.1 hypothetical protein EHSB41UT_04682 [Parendozoicomonas haliclonae]
MIKNLGRNLGAGLLAASFAHTAAATQKFSLTDEIDGTLDTSLSWGTLWRMNDPKLKGDDPENENDSRRAFDKGLVSNVFRISSELELSYRDFGAYVRGTAFYDSVLMDGENKWSKWNSKQIAAGEPDQTGTYPYGKTWADDVKDLQGKGVEIQDAFVYGSWFFENDMVLDARFGKQVINWGEGLFYVDGINTTNAFNVASGSLPGSQIKDFLIPQTALSFDLGITNNLSMGAYYQFDWEATVLPGRGTFYNDTDIFVDGADFGYNKIPDDLMGLEAGWQGATGGALGSLYSQAGIRDRGDYFIVATTDGKVNASDSGQWGVNFKYLVEEWNDTEFGLYFIRYNSHFPYIEATLSPESVLAAQQRIGDWTNDGTTGPDNVDFMYNFLQGVAQQQLVAQGLPVTPETMAMVQAEVAGTLAGAGAISSGADARRIYPEGIRMYGLSFSTVVGSTSVAGELTYRPNMPIWVDDPDNILNSISNGMGSILSGNDCVAASQATGQLACITKEWHKNYERVELWTGSVNFIHSFGPVRQIGLDQLEMVGEMAFEQISGMKDYDRYVSTKSDPWTDNGAAGFPAHKASDRLDRFAWGYTLSVGGQIHNVLPGLNLYPGVSYKRSVSGNSHLTGSFKSGDESASFSLGAGYKDFGMGLTYNPDFGGKKDFLSVTASYSF